MKKSHNVKKVKKSHNTVAKEMKSSHTNDDDFASQHSYSNTDHTIKSHTINTENNFNQQKSLIVDVNQIDNSHSNDCLNLIKVSESEELKSLNYSQAINVIKTSNSHELNVAISHSYDLNVKSLNKMTTLILDYLDDLRRCNNHSHDLDELNSKQILIEMKNNPKKNRHRSVYSDLLIRSTYSDILIRSTNDKDVST